MVCFISCSYEKVDAKLKYQKSPISRKGDFMLTMGKSFGGY